MAEHLKVTVHRSMNSLPDDQVPLDVLEVRFKAMKEFNFWNLEMDCRRFAEMITIWREKELYKHFYDSWQEFLDDYIEKPQEWVDRIVEGVALLDNSKPISTQDALEAAIENAKQNPNSKHGTNQHTTGGYNITSSKRGTSQEYLARRLARDNPEVLDEIGEGKKFKSVRQAAIHAGIVKPKITVQFDPDESGGQIVSKLYQKLSDEQWESLLTALNDFHP